jgi:alkylation response protein AidB-like acyl-CoA dehydrogenase
MTVSFIPTSDQDMFRSQANRWVSQSYSSTGNAADQWAEIAELGWLMIALPEEAGGVGGSAYDAAVIAEELGRGLVKLPVVEIALSTSQVVLDVAPEMVEALGTGEARPLLAHDEPGARGDPAYVTTQAIGDEEGWRLTGRKTGLVGAPLADRFLVTARTPDGKLSLFEVEADSDALLVFNTIDDRPAGELRLANTPARRIGDGDVSTSVARAFDVALVLESAEALGSMQAALDLTRDYLKTRKQYGQYISEFQALQHRLADMFIELEQARSMILRGLGALDPAVPEAERTRLAAATKARTAKAAHFVGAQAIQLHGGIGVTEDYEVGHHFKRLTAFCTRHGTAEAQVERYAELSRL